MTLCHNRTLPMSSPVGGRLDGSRARITRIVFFTLICFSAAATSAGPRAVTPDPVYDFGVRENADSVEHAFTLVNDGDEPLKILDVRTNCGCTVATLDKREVAPGQSMLVRATLHLQGRHGPQLKTVLLATNDPENAQVLLTFKGEAIETIEVQPNYISFGSLDDAAEGAEADLRLTFRRPGITVEKIFFTDDTGAFKVTEKAGASADPDVRTFTVMLKQDLPPGGYRDTLVFTTNYEHRPRLQIDLFARIRDSIELVPKSIVLPAGASGQKRYIFVTRGTVKNFTVLDASTPLPDVVTKAEKLPTGDVRISVDGLSASEIPAGTQLHIRTDVKGKEDLFIPVIILPPSPLASQSDSANGR
jgi:hypothetical protein